MFGDQDFDVIGEINIGTGTQLRLIQTSRGKKRIETWSSLSKRWNVMYRYDVMEAWEAWNRIAKGIEERKAQAKPVAKTKKQPKKIASKTPRKPRKKKDD